MSLMILRHLAVIADWGSITCRQRGRSDGGSNLLMGSDRDVGLGRDPLNAMCNAATLCVPCPVSTNEAVKRLMLTNTLD